MRSDTNRHEDQHSNTLQHLWVSCPHLSVELDGEDVVGVAVVTNLCSLLEVVDVHSSGHGKADHHDQAAGEQSLHYVDVRTLH